MSYFSGGGRDCIHQLPPTTRPLISPALAPKNLSNSHPSEDISTSSRPSLQESSEPPKIFKEKIRAIVSHRTLKTILMMDIHLCHLVSFLALQVLKKACCGWHSNYPFRSMGALRQSLCSTASHFWHQETRNIARYSWKTLNNPVLMSFDALQSLHNPTFCLATDIFSILKMPCG